MNPKILVELSQNAVPPAERATMLEEPGFGRVFTDHMLTAAWTQAEDWHDMRIGARRPFSIDPACAVLHYAQEIFEGLKAYRSNDGALTLFRPERNASRFNSSARRLSMPKFPEQLFVDAVEALVTVDEAWVPHGDGSLYIRPFMFASDAFLGVRSASRFTFCVIASPAGSYFKGEARALSLWVSEDLNRAGPGGTGAAKCGGNYAASLKAQVDAQERGCDQVVFLDAVEHRWVDELGGMNVFFVFDDGSVSTPPLTGTILPGITRASIIELLRLRGVSVTERPYAIDEWRADAQSGRLREVFACGTAAVVTPIGHVRSTSGDWMIGGGAGGPLTADLREELVAIQRGERPGPNGWVRRLEIR